MDDVGIFYGHLVYFVTIWYIWWLFGILSPVWACCTKENLVTLFHTQYKFHSRVRIIATWASYWEANLSLPFFLQTSRLSFRGGEKEATEVGVAPTPQSSPVMRESRSLQDLPQVSIFDGSYFNGFRTFRHFYLAAFWYAYVGRYFR
jgi:hypothetical protein